MMDAFPQRNSSPEIECHHVRLLGTGAAAPTKQIGRGITVTRTSAGLYKLTWAETPGTFVGISGAFGAATPDDMQGHTFARDTYDATAFSLEVLVQDSAFNVDDLEANEYLDLQVYFTRTAA